MAPEGHEVNDPSESTQEELEHIARLDAFLGYGTADAPCWAVGLEEHCDEDDLDVRLDLLERSPGFQRAIPFHRQLAELLPERNPARVKIERVVERGADAVPLWRRSADLCDAAFGLESNEPDDHVAFLELYPFPRPDHERWPAAIYSTRYGIESLAECRNRMPIAQRGQRLVELADRHPAVRLVLLNGRGTHGKWVAPLMGEDPEPRPQGEGRWTKLDTWTRNDVVWALTDSLSGGVRWRTDDLVRLAEELQRRVQRLSHS